MTATIEKMSMIIYTKETPGASWAKWLIRLKVSLAAVRLDGGAACSGALR